MANKELILEVNHDYIPSRQEIFQTTSVWSFDLPWLIKLDVGVVHSPESTRGHS